MNQRHFQQQCQSLYLILKGCLNERTIQQSTQLLKKKAIQQQEFIHQLCFLINKAEADTLIMIMSTLKNFLMARYNNQQEPISNNQKDFLKNNIFKIFYQIYPQNAPIKIYKEIIYIMIAVDYPWPGLFNKIQQDLNNSIIASIYFMRQVAKVNEWFVAQEDRKIIEEFIIQYFPKIENVINKIFQNFNPQTSELLHQVLKTFYSAFHIEIPFYLRNLDNLDRWIMYFETILNAPTESVGLKNQQMASRIYYKFFTLYCNSVSQNKNYSNWVRQFIIRFAQRLFQTIVNLIGQKKGSQTLLSNLINCLHQVIKSQQLRPLYTNQHCQILFYGNILLPMCQSNNDQLNIFKNDPIEYIRRQDDLTCQPIRRAILDTIQIAASSLNFNGKSQMIRIVQYSANVLQTSANDLQKQVIIRILSKIGKLILKNKHLKSQFQNLTIQYFIPLLTNENPLLNATVCQLLSLYLPFGELDNQTVSTLMELIYDKIVNSKYLVVKYNAILSFTALLNHKTALQATMPYFKNILEIYVSMLNTFDHQNLLDCLQSIVKYFSSEIVGYAPELITHLLTMFSSLSKNNGQQDQDEDEPDTNNSAKAALSTIKEILMCQLSPETYFNISKDLFQLYRGIFNQFDNFFDEILTLMNVLVYKSKEVYQYQYIYVSCRKLLEQKFYIHPNTFSNDIIQQLSKIQTSDNQFEESLVSILKNLIQKMPLQVLYKYSFPSHPQLIFCLIQNQKLRPQDFNNLNTSQLNDLWTQYISSYTFMIYGIGSMSNTNTLKSIIGVSLFPWIKNGLNIELVKIIINSVEEQNEQDEDMYEENTAQLLQKYANEDDEQQEEYYEGLGTNYALLYDSPFDSTKDKNQLIQQLKSLPQIEANNLFNLLSNTYRKKLQILLN